MRDSSIVTEENPITVLLAEDEPMLRQVVGQTLRHSGYRVIEAEDGTAGLEMLRSEALIDVLLTDVKMPGLNGYELAEAGLSLRPTMKVMLMTGYADEAIPDAIRLASIPILRKPFDFAKLASSVREGISPR